MSGSASDNMALVDLMKAESEGLDLNRLLFVRFLVLSKRLTEDLDNARVEEPVLQAA
jgi:hypothetical protein